MNIWIYIYIYTQWFMSMIQFDPTTQFNSTIQFNSIRRDSMATCRHASVKGLCHYSCRIELNRRFALYCRTELSPKTLMIK